MLPESQHSLELEDEDTSVLPFALAKAQFEERYIRRLLKNAQGNVSQAARNAGVHRAQVCFGAPLEAQIRHR